MIDERETEMSEAPEAEKCDVTFETVECQSGEEFLAFVSPWNRRWWATQRASRPELDHSSSWVFRGQPNDQWGLTPSSFRPTSYSNHPFEHFVRTLPSGDLVVMTAQMEWLRLVDFVEAADAQGIALPEDSYALRRTWLTRSRFAAPIELVQKDGGAAWPPDELLPIVAFAQHHGIPTRLLDWSTSPFVAAYFAAASGEPHAKMAVWALDTSRLRKCSANLELVRLPNAPNSNLVKQRGAFTLDRSVRFTPIDQVVWTIDVDELPPVVKVTVPTGDRASILGALSVAGFNRATLYSGGDAIAAYVLRELENMRMLGPVRTGPT